MQDCPVEFRWHPTKIDRDPCSWLVERRVEMANKLIESIRERTTTYLDDKNSSTKVMTSDKDRT